MTGYPPRRGKAHLLRLERDEFRLKRLFPPLGGEGRGASLDARRGGVTVSTPGTAHEERLSPHPASRCTRVDPPPSGEGKMSVAAIRPKSIMPWRYWVAFDVARIRRSDGGRSN